jgi:pimeloyl-ACP methyl ester carboxylesterase
MGIWWCPGCLGGGPADNGLVPGLLREGRVTANGLRFAYLEGGSGPLVVLLHGWPDTPYTWDHQLAALAGAGFRVAAPWLRGYPPTEIPRSGYFDIGTLAVDVRELIGVLGGGDPCLLVGQDWGASIGYQVLAAFPEVVRSAVVMAVPHPAAARESLLRAEHVHRSFHWFFFQLPQLPERALRADGYAFVDWLWDYWTAPGFTDEEHLAEVKRMLAVPGALEATLGYYRAMFDPARADPGLAEVRQAAGRPIVVPTLALCGAEDKRAEVMQDQARHFAGPYRFELVPGSSHFLQREQPQAVTKLVLDWFARQ